MITFFYRFEGDKWRCVSRTRDWWGEPKPREAEAIFSIGADSLHMIDIVEEREVLENFFSKQMKY